MTSTAWIYPSSCPTGPENATLTGADVDAASDATDPEPNNSTDQAADVDTTDAIADLEITVDSVPTLKPSETGVIDLNVHNHGPSDSGQFDVTFALPAGVAFDTTHANPDGCVESAGVVTCTVAGPLADGADHDVVIPILMLTNQPTSGPIAPVEALVENQTVTDDDSDNDAAAATPVLDLSGDTDGDGIPDHLEIDPHGTGIPLDTDGDGTPDYLDLDSDNDGILDADETDGGDPTVDTDGDGIPDYRDLDSDNDGILDVEEGGNGALDADNDGTIDSMDNPATGDVDGDGLADAADTTRVDTNTDGVDDYRDLDSDGDNIPDVEEGGNGALDADNDGTIDSMDNPATGDVDGDGLADNVPAQAPTDTDNDGTPDYQSLDADGDGIPDSVEAGVDPTQPIDSDGDGSPDYQDLNSDNDGEPDSVEAGADPNNPVDTDNDGIADYRDPLGATLSGDVFEDLDRDGTRDGGEPSLSGVEVMLVSPGPDGEFGTSDDVVVETITTDGPFAFTNVDDGDYRVVVNKSTLATGLFATDDSDGGSDQIISITVDGATVYPVNFGENFAAVSGVFTSPDGNPVPNTEVTLTDAAGNTFTTTTDADGRYMIEGTMANPIAAGEAQVAGTWDGRPVVQELTIEGANEVVVANLAATATPSSNPQSIPSSTPAGPLAFTGASSAAQIWIGMVLVLAGLAFTVVSRRRQGLRHATQA